MPKLLVIDDGPGDGAGNMERDRALLAAHRPGQDPVLRIYRWRPPALSIGYNQDESAFDREAAAAAGLDIVRRPTGGRAILHADELTYAVIGTSPGPVFGASLHETYMTINGFLADFLRRQGAEVEISGGESRAEAMGNVCFKSAGRHELAVAGRKLVGSAQRRSGGCFLQHGSILTGPGHVALPDFLRPDAPGGDMTPAVLAGLTTDLSRVMGRPLGDDDLDALSADLAAACAERLELDAVQLAAGTVP